MAREPKTITPAGTKSPQQNRTLPVTVVLATLLLVAVGIAGYFYYQYQKSLQPKDVSDIETLVTTLGKMIELPEGETPTLATVTDREKLAEQPFFQKAENGDKVLIYSQSGRAILYRPSTGKIVDMTTVNVQTPPAETPAPEAPVPAPTPSAEEAVPLIVRATLLNGSTTIGATNGVEVQMKQNFKNVAVVSKESAKKNDYTGMLVIDLTGSNATVAKDIAESLGGQVASLPDGETRPSDVDILIIVGNK